MPKSVLVIGGGVVGLSTAYYCASRDFDVTVIERGNADHDGCSFGNAGLLIPSHVVPLSAPGMVKLGLKYMLDPGSPFYVKPRLTRDLFDWGWKFFRAANAAQIERAAPLIAELNMASRDLYFELAGLCNNSFDLQKLGVMNICQTEHGMEHEVKAARLAQKCGLEAEIVDAKRAAELQPGLRLNVIGGVYYPQDCFLSPSKFMACLTRLVRDRGVKFEWETQLNDWQTKNGRVESARTSSGDFSADEYVVCSGSWTPRLVRTLGVRLSLQAGKGYSLTMTNPPHQPRIAMICSEARVAITPMGDTLRFAGTMEIAGLDESITSRRVQRIITASCSYMPDFKPSDFAGIEPWRGLRPCTPDGLPYVGRTNKYTNLSIAAGHAMMGLSLGPITGRLISDVLSGEKPSIEIELLSPNRYD